MELLLFPLLMFALLWVMAIRPQQQRVRKQRELVASLDVGDEVVTAGGIVGRIVGLDGDEIRLEVAPGVVMRILRVAVQGLVGPEEEEEPPAPEETIE